MDYRRGRDVRRDHGSPRHHITGWMAGYFGRKSLLMMAVVGFTAWSVLCGMAPNLGLLIFFRVLPGASGGAL